MNIRPTILAASAVAAVVLTACGAEVAASDVDDAAAPTTVPAESAAPAAGPAVATRDSELGPVLTDADGLTLYGFTNDVDAVSTCYDVCAEAWPPLRVQAGFVAAPGVDTAILATAARDDGASQLVAGRFPLYTFGGDTVPGDLNGHGSGDVWFAVGADGRLLDEDADVSADEAGEDEAVGPVTTGDTGIGEVMVDADGLTLYGFLPDRDAGPTCVDACADAWPPLTVDGEELPDGLDAELFAVTTRPDGTAQLVAGAWPLYRFAGDAAPGDVAGQGSGDQWFAVAADGSLAP